MKQASAKILLHKSPNKKDLQPFTSVNPCHHWCARQDSNVRPTNHSFFWPLLKKNVKFEGKVKDAVNAKFGDFDSFKKAFSSAAALLFGSGWAWLVLDKNDLRIITTPNQDNPLSQGKTPLLGLDIWEHAYYLKYQNRRPEYIEAFFNVINWNKVDEHYRAAS